MIFFQKDMNLKSELKKYPNKNVVIYLSAKWCKFCTQIESELEELSQDPDNIIIKVDVDQTPEFASKFTYPGLPTLLLIRNGLFIKQISGLKSKADLQNWLSTRVPTNNKLPIKIGLIFGGIVILMTLAKMRKR